MNKQDKDILMWTQYLIHDADIIDALRRRAVGQADLMADAFPGIAKHMNLDEVAKACQQVVISVRPDAGLDSHTYSAMMMQAIGLAFVQAWQKVAADVVNKDAEAQISHARYLQAIHDGAVQLIDHAGAAA